MRRESKRRPFGPLSRHHDFLRRFRIRVVYEKVRPCLSWRALSVPDRRIYHGLPPASGRRTSFLLSRSAVRRLCEGNGVVLSRTRSSIGHRAGGQPFIPGVLPIGFRFLSVSHSRERAFVAVSHRMVGVDVEYIRSDDPVWSNAFLSPMERVWFSAMVDRAGGRAHAGKALTVWWCAKEAYLKALGVGLRLHPKRIICYIDWEKESFTLHSSGKPVGRGVFFCESDEYVLALAVRED